MTAKESVLDLLRQQKQREGADKHADVQARKNEWLQTLSELRKMLLDWMNEAVAAKLLEVEPFQQPVTEERLGAYDAPALKIVTPTGIALRITPKARDVIGGYGRVDLECTPKKAILIRKDPTHWQFAELTPERGGWSFKDLTEDSYWETLRNLLS